MPGYSGRIKKAATVLMNMMDAASFKDLVSGIGWDVNKNLATQYYDQFEKNVEAFIKLFPNFFPVGCRDGCAPEFVCGIPSCCKQKGFTMCAECDEIGKCEKIAKKYVKMQERMKEIKALGIEKWAKEQQKKIDATDMANLMKAVQKTYESE